ncbi:MAG: hypothetical protein AB7K24_03450 [Gemmataceae bacterium]
MFRSIVAVIGGALAGGVFNMGVIMLSWVMFPPPEGADLSDPATLKAYVESLPTAAFFVILAAHAGGALVGGFVAALFARRSPIVLGTIVGGLFLIGGIVNVMSIPRPLWFAVADLVLYVPCGILGARLAPKRTSA